MINMAFRRKRLLEIIKEWKPIIKRPKIFGEIIGGILGREERFEIPLPPGITEEDLIDIVSKSKWARDLAIGIATRGGLKPGTKAYETFVDTFSKAVATGWVRSSGYVTAA
jgi:hypothetical protein